MVRHTRRKLIAGKRLNGNRNGAVSGERVDYPDIVRANHLFERFYESILGLPADEFAAMMTAFRIDLPASFRITASRSEAAALCSLIERHYISPFMKTDADGADVTVSGATRLPWYQPAGMAWQLPLTRKQLRRDASHAKLHRLLVAETEAGNVSRQETVSMVPPLILDVRPHHVVLDMCAAPGSKTSQLIESLHQSDVDGDTSAASRASSSAAMMPMPSGLVVANDVDNGRCYTLVHQAKRVQSANVVITNHDASTLPNFFITSPAESNNNGKSLTKLEFDRILADVPCSGDGTMRKNCDIWPTWTPTSCLPLHSLQYRILRRAIELLAVGGRVVYSTCSMHPVENEAVIGRILVECGSTCLKLESNVVSTYAPGLRHAAGLTDWHLMSKDGSQVYYTAADVPKSHSGATGSQHIVPSMFPPDDDNIRSKLVRCVRIQPHMQNTGAFFVAALTKIGPCPWMSPEECAANGSSKSLQRESRKKARHFGFREDPFVYLPEKAAQDENGEGDGSDARVAMLAEARHFFGISVKLADSHFMTRCRDLNTLKTVYLSASLARNLVHTNETLSAQVDASSDGQTHFSLPPLKIINTGVKVLARCDGRGSAVKYRLTQEGIAFILPYIEPTSCRVVTVTQSDMVTLLMTNDIDAPPAIEAMAEPTRHRLDAIDTGSCVFTLGVVDDTVNITIVGWKGATSVRSYVCRADRLHYLRLLGVNDAELPV